jgi:acetylglutamate kinase
LKTILIKGSGDVTERQEFLDFITEKSKKDYVVVICGGGSKINKALKEGGYSVQFDDSGRRITKTPEEKTIARNILEKERNILQDKFYTKNVFVLLPILYAGAVICHINGDDLVKAYELGFDEIFIFTKEKRIEKKKLIFKNNPKVTIIGV